MKELTYYEWLEEHHNKAFGEVYEEQEKESRRITQLHAILLSYFNDKEEHSQDIYRFVNADYWTLSDLIVRQFLNNGGDGFGISNVEDGYRFVEKHKHELRFLNMLSEIGWNNSNMIIWENWEI